MVPGETESDAGCVEGVLITMRRKSSFSFVLLLLAGCTISASGISFQLPTIPAKPNARPSVDQVFTHEFRCLIVQDADAVSKLTSAQLSMLTGKNVRDFLKANCVKDSAGNPQFRFVDRTKTDELTGVWSGMIKAYPPKGYPWVILTNGSSGTGKTLPTDWDTLKNDFETFAGVK